MRAQLLALGLTAITLTACVDGVTPDCSKANCGTPTSDGAVVVDSGGDASSDGSSDATTDGASDAGSDAKADGSVDAKTD